jgi:LCP family protein required for cell wall assembly
VVVAVCLSGLSFVGYTLIKYNGIQRFDDLEVDAAPAGEPQNYLLVGSDSRAGASAAEQSEVGGQRSDTIMVVRVDPAEEAADILSLPRDLTVPIAGTGEVTKINSAYSIGTPEEGRQRLIDTIRDNFGIDIHHYVEIDFQGFSRLVDAVGGVELYFEVAVRDTDAGLYQFDLGCQTLTGEEALPFVRSRKLQFMTPDGWEYDPYADLGRITRQQIFIRQAVSKTVDQMRSNPLKLTQLIDIGTDSVGLDDQIGISDIRDLGERFKDFDQERLRTHSLPVVDNDDGATVSMNRAEAEPILNLFRGLDPGEISPGLVQVTVLNGTETQGQANDVAGALQAVGFDVVGTGNAPLVPFERTTVYHAPGEEIYGQRVARHITGGANLAVNDALGAGQVDLVTGLDFETVHQEPTPLDQMPSTTVAGGGGDSSATSASTTTTTAPTTTTTGPTTTTTRAGFAAGEAPGGRTC